MKTLIIIPCYNEENRLPIQDFIHFFKAEQEDIRFLFVNDGSTDNTINILNDLEKRFQVVRVLDLKQNVGKAEAVRTAMLKSVSTDFDYICYFDADLATPLEEIYQFIAKAEKYNPLVIMGSRVKLLGITKIKRKWHRHYFGRVFATIASNMLKIPVYDTQCGAKMIKASIIKELFASPFISSWLFDVEMLFRLKNLQVYNQSQTPIIELPLTRWEDKGDSKFPLSYLFKFPFELIRIYL
ncbi:MAG: glycosyltransferase family 2 protein [Bacteroidetes bacterium]|nr:MAG: glycosyltransferase family 2 protein [Bacteroidota bacterium]MBL1144855.1 glycosyltransferase family 2 protein [Bacteroidota bacterium]MCB0801816.1 glycosyltransferase family 2 protein [Flavobacteriales bacterium]NOG57649.1 glycosyltransferase family 2 protein [Bacteroidota bacterium]